MATCNHQADSPLYVEPDVRSGEKSVVICNTECPSWDQVSLNTTKVKLALVVLHLVVLTLRCTSGLRDHLVSCLMLNSTTSNSISWQQLNQLPPMEPLCSMGPLYIVPVLQWLWSIGLSRYFVLKWSLSYAPSHYSPIAYGQLIPGASEIAGWHDTGRQ